MTPFALPSAGLSGAEHWRTWAREQKAKAPFASHPALPDGDFIAAGTIPKIQGLPYRSDPRL